MTEPFDPLISQPPAELDPPAGLTADERARWLLEAVFDHVNLHAIAFPARDRDGSLQAPPDTHVLDYLARANDLVDEERSLTTLSASTVAVLATLPTCDICGAAARYDASIVANDETGGAYMCGGCYHQHGSGTLGASGDTYLLTFDEVSDWVRGRYDAIAESLGKPPLRSTKR